MRALALTLIVLVTPATVAGQERPSSAVVAPAALEGGPWAPTLTEQEQFLREAKVGKVKGVKKGITGTQRATLTAGIRTHDVSIQSIDESRARFESMSRTEFNFRDYWGYNVAAYRIGLLLGIDMIPPSVARRFRQQDAAFTWWIDDVVMDEQARLTSGIRPPDPASWAAQVHIMRVFDELIANTDRNQGNMLIDRQWKMWLIDHTRAFRTSRVLRAPQIIRRCERTLLARMKGLTLEAMKAELHQHLTPSEMQAVLARRDLLVEWIESLGPQALYDLQRPGPGTH
jgi:hypothetical protein